MQTIKIDRDTENSLNLIVGFINRAKKKQVVTLDTLTHDMLRHGVREYFRGNIELVEKKEELPNAHQE